MRRSLVILAGLLLALPQTGCSFRAFKAHKSITETADHVAGSALQVKSRNGRLEVEAEPQRGDVLVEARITCSGTTQEQAEERLAATTLRVTREADDRLVVTPVFAGGFQSGDGASINVRLPDARDVELDTSNGAVVARGLGGDLVVDTSNGSVAVADHAGPARVDTSNGRVTVTDHSGPVAADTSNGNVRIVRVSGPVTADTSNGSIEVTLADGQPGPLRLDTSNGAITVSVGAGFAGEVRLETSNGAIHVDDRIGAVTRQHLRRDRGTVVVGEGGEPSRLDTSNGAIRFTIEG